MGLVVRPKPSEVGKDDVAAIGRPVRLVVEDVGLAAGDRPLVSAVRVYGEQGSDIAAVIGMAPDDDSAWRSLLGSRGRRGAG